MKHSGNATRSGRAGHRRFHAKNFLVAAARSFAAGLALPAPARRVAAQPDCNRNLPPFSVRSPADETLERTQRPLIFRCNETDRITDGVCAAGASDAMDIIL